MRNPSGNAHAPGLSYTPAISGGRAGIIGTAFREECETGLFGELVVLSAAERSGSSASQSKAPHREVWGDHALSRYPVLKIHLTAAMHTIKKARIMPRLTPALISEVP